MADEAGVDEAAESVVVCERRGAILVLRINRPEARNSLSLAVLRELGRGLEEAETDPEIRCVILTGTGDRAFCAGMDLREFAAGGMTPEDATALETFGRFVAGNIDVPIVGAANATAVAGGFELLMGCDVVVASDHAKFGLPEVKRGLFAAGGGVYLSTRIPLAIALEMTLTGDTIDAARAYALGLVNTVVPAEAVMDEAVALAERIAANGPLALRATKRLVRMAALTPDKVAAVQAELQPQVFGSADAREGATAFVERRPPVWTGR